jgi:hypothetical protein
VLCALQDALCVSPVIKFATVVGQDCKHLGALVVADPDALAEAAAAQGGRPAAGPVLLTPDVTDCQALIHPLAMEAAKWSGCIIAAGVEELSRQQVQQLVRKEVTAATASRISREHIRLLKVRWPVGRPTYQTLLLPICQHAWSCCTECLPRRLVGHLHMHGRVLVSPVTGDQETPAVLPAGARRAVQPGGRHPHPHHEAAAGGHPEALCS